MNWLAHTDGPNPKNDIKLVGLEDGQTNDVQSEQFRKAYAAALTLLDTVGAADDPVEITIAGYAYDGHNPGDQPNETLSITIHARPQPVLEDGEVAAPADA